MYVESESEWINHHVINVFSQVINYSINPRQLFHKTEMNRQVNSRDFEGCTLMCTVNQHTVYAIPEGSSIISANL